MIVDDILIYTPKDISGYLQAFADDLVSPSEGNDSNMICDRTHKSINKPTHKAMNKWCHTNELPITSFKTKIVMFTRNERSTWELTPKTCKWLYT